MVYLDLSENTFTIRYNDTQKDAVPPIPYDGVPFIIRGKKTLECHQGKDRSKKKKERAQLLRNKEVRLRNFLAIPGGFLNLLTFYLLPLTRNVIYLLVHKSFKKHISS